MTEPQRFPYSAADTGGKGGLPFVPVTLLHGDQRTQVPALVDSGATVNVLPYDVGLHLGLAWEEQDFALDVVGVLRGSPAYGVLLSGEIGAFSPVNRPWGEPGSPLVMKKPYWETGPHIGDDSRAVNFHWTVSDLLNSMSYAGLNLVRLRESRSAHTRIGRSYRETEKNDGQADWREDALAGLPMWLTVNSRKAQ